MKDHPQRIEYEEHLRRRRELHRRVEHREKCEKRVGEPVPLLLFEEHGGSKDQVEGQEHHEVVRRRRDHLVEDTADIVDRRRAHEIRRQEDGPGAASARHPPGDSKQRQALRRDEQREVPGRAVERTSGQELHGVERRQRKRGAVVAEAVMQKREAGNGAVLLDPPDALRVVEAGVDVQVAVRGGICEEQCKETQRGRSRVRNGAGHRITASFPGPRPFCEERTWAAE